jgi:anaerobic ribonucleoside-triphosphate reductase
MRKSGPGLSVPNVCIMFLIFFIRSFRMVHHETTDLTLFVRSSKEDITGWNRQRIVDALIRETNVDIETAQEISREVEHQISASGIDFLTAPLIRELVDAKLIERGLGKASKMHARLGLPLFDVEQLILYSNKENANIPHNPEGTNLTLAEGIKKEYALLKVFSDDVGYAHAIGDIHIHNLGYVDRPYCSCQSIEFIKKFGLNISNSIAVTSPAKHAETLLAHIIRFAAALQGNFAGAVGWDGVNIFFAPYLVNLSDDEVKQLAQMLVYEFAQQAVGRGGQTIFTDIHLYWEMPDHFRDTPALGPGGEYTGRTYGEYEEDSRRFATALFDVYEKGDATGRPFVFPRPMVHMTESFFQTPGHEDFLTQICRVALEKGNTHFVFDRHNSVSLSECGTICFEKGKGKALPVEKPWEMRHAAIQNVSINLPRLGYRAKKEGKDLFSLISRAMEITAQAHVEKKHFIEGLLSLGSEGPLSLLAMDCGGTRYIRADLSSYLVGMVGLNELVKIETGKELHESEEAREFGLKIITHMKEMADKLSTRHGIGIMLEQSPAETTAYRFARLDMKHFSPTAGHFVKGDIAKGEIYYTNSTQFAVSASIDPMERVKLEAAFHPLIEGDAVTYIRIADESPSPRALADFVTQALRESEGKHLVFTPEFTTCLDCNQTVKGLRDLCPHCGSDNIEEITRITGYFSRVSHWNRGKIGELRDRKKGGSFSDRG